jgi:hypothetical protein
VHRKHSQVGIHTHEIHLTHRYTCHARDSAQNDCVLLLDICHTADFKSCKQGNVTVSAAAGKYIVTGSVLHAGDLSGRDGGIHVYVYAEVSASADSGGVVCAPGSSVDCVYGLWMNNAIPSPVTSGGPSAGATDSAKSNSLGVYLRMGHTPQPGSTVVVEVRVGISFVDADNARHNLYADQGSGLLPFDAVVARTQQLWEAALSRVKIDADLGPGADDVDGYPLKRTFYSSSYRAALAPTTYSEWDGRYVGMDKALHKINAGGDLDPVKRYMSDMSIWDIHRTQARGLIYFIFVSVGFFVCCW